MIDLPEVGSSRLSWLADPLSLDELEAILDQCNTSCLGLDGLRFSHFKAFPMEAKKLCRLDIYNDILATGLVPQSWHRTKVVPIEKPVKDPLLSGSSGKNGIISPTQYGFRNG
jgi:hypothetical protein